MNASAPTLRRPHGNLMSLYLLRAILTGPAIFITLPLLYFRYHTLRYRIDDEGIGMSWGILFRREVNLTYARVQDIHLTSGPIQRWLGLADIHIQTASGSAAAEMVIEGLQDYLQLRDFLYGRMRGARDPSPGAAGPAAAVATTGDEDLAGTLLAVRDELRATRQAIEALAAKGGADG